MSFVRNFQTVCFILKNEVASYTYDAKKQQHCLFFLDEGPQVRVLGCSLASASLVVSSRSVTRSLVNTLILGSFKLEYLVEEVGGM